jgi:hypothetical protein
MFEVRIFTEILIVGLFMLVGLWPLFLLVKKEVKEQKKEEAQRDLKAGEHEGHDEPLAAEQTRWGKETKAGGADDDLFPITDDYVSKVKRVVMLLMLAYAVGAAGNRLADDFWDRAFKRYHFDEKYEELLKAETRGLREQQALNLPQAAHEGQSRLRCEGMIADKKDCLKVALMLLRERSEATQDWLDNRRAYIRIMRAASLSLMLLMVSMFIYKVRWWRTSHRYRMSHFALALFFLGVITFAHMVAERKYWKHVYEYYAGLPAVAAKAEK